ncbi:MAG: hypothetical protein WAP35_09215 [Solirubrobacterales bacterium]
MSSYVVKRPARVRYIDPSKRDWYYDDEVAAANDRNVETVRRWLRAGTISGDRPGDGKVWQIPRESLTDAGLQIPGEVIDSTPLLRQTTTRLIALASTERAGHLTHRQETIAAVKELAGAVAAFLNATKG